MKNIPFSQLPPKHPADNLIKTVFVGVSFFIGLYILTALLIIVLN